MFKKDSAFKYNYSLPSLQSSFHKLSVMVECLVKPSPILGQGRSFGVDLHMGHNKFLTEELLNQVNKL